MTHVLIVEDNALFLESLASALELQGYTVQQAHDGAEALALLRAGKASPDIILSDISMPNADGYAVLEAVRQTEALREVPFLFLTAHNSSEAVRAGKVLGVDDYLVKPFSVDDLIVAMENKLRRVRDVRQSVESAMDADRQHLMNMISHELRTPLQAIHGGAELLADSLSASPDVLVHEMLGFLQMGVDRLNRMVKNILLLVELDSGQLGLHFDDIAQVTDFRGVVHSACKSVQTSSEFVDKEIRLEIATGPAPVMVRGLAELLELMVAEPLRNAYAFSPIGGHVQVTLTPNGELLEMTITDEGPGITSEQMSRIWERFVQIDRRRREQQGIGMGLPLTRASARLHRGDCAVETVARGGLCFTLTLPTIQS